MLKKILYSSLLSFSFLSFSNAQLIEVEKGWKLYGAIEDLNSSNFNKSCVDFVWKYNKEWELNTLSSSKPSSIKGFDIINKGQGFWISAKENCIIDTSDYSKNYKLISHKYEEYYKNDINLLEFVYYINSDGIKKKFEELDYSNEGKLLKHTHFLENDKPQEETFYNDKGNISKIILHSRDIGDNEIKPYKTISFKYDENHTLIEKKEESITQGSTESFSREKWIKTYDKNNELISHIDKDGNELIKKDEIYSNDGKLISKLIKHDNYTIKRVFRYDEKTKIIGYTDIKYQQNIVKSEVNASYVYENNELKEILFDTNLDNIIDAKEVYKIENNKKTIEYKEDKNNNNIYEYTLTSNYDENENILSHFIHTDINEDKILELRKSYQLKRDEELLSILVTIDDKIKKLDIPLETKIIKKVIKQKNSIYNFDFDVEAFDINNKLRFKLRILDTAGIIYEIYDEKGNTLKGSTYENKNGVLSLKRESNYNYDKFNNRSFYKLKESIYIDEENTYKFLTTKEEINTYNENNNLVFYRIKEFNKNTNQLYTLIEKSLNYNSNNKTLYSETKVIHTGNYTDYFYYKKYYKYDSNNKLLEVKSYDHDTYSTKEYTYNEKGEVLKTKVCDETRNNCNIEIFDYNENGKIKSEKKYSIGNL